MALQSALGVYTAKDVGGSIRQRGTQIHDVTVAMKAADKPAASTLVGLAFHSNLFQMSQMGRDFVFWPQPVTGRRSPPLRERMEPCER